MHTFSNHPIGLLPMEQNYDPSKPSIAEFFAGRDIFVTGGTGFMGKVLIEKLLRSCSELNNIYVLIREKKQKSIQERIQEMQQLPLFEKLRQEQPELLNKMVPVQGDVSLLGLGLSPDDIEKMRNVSVIFHVAASVRFDDPLKTAILLNTRGTRELVQFAEQLPSLRVLMHVSSTYSNPDRYVIEEEVYPAYADWRDTIRIAETFDEQTLDVLAPKYMGFLPNTYVFTKSLAEQIVNEHKDRLPMILFRPSIVISSMKDPIPGWMDNFNGPVGLLVGCGIGICRTMYCDPNNIADFTPVDVCIKAMIVAAWKRGTEPVHSTTKQDLPIYNCCISNLRNSTMSQIVEMGRTLSDEIPLDKCIWAPGGGITQIRIHNLIRVLLYHILPAILIDGVFRLMGQKPFLAKLQRKIYTANVALEYFILNNWDFKNGNFIKLASEIKPEDNKDFYYRDFIEFDVTLYFRNCILGARRYLLKEKDENIPRALTHLKRMKLLDKICKTIIVAVFLYIILIQFDMLGMILYLISYKPSYPLEVECK